MYSFPFIGEEKIKINQINELNLIGLKYERKKSNQVKEKEKNAPQTLMGMIAYFRF